VSDASFTEKVPGQDKCERYVHLDLNTIIKSLLQQRNVIIQTFYTLSPPPTLVIIICGEVKQIRLSHTVCYWSRYEATTFVFSLFLSLHLKVLSSSLGLTTSSYSIASLYVPLYSWCFYLSLSLFLSLVFFPSFSFHCFFPCCHTTCWKTLLVFSGTR
jgi:hypothetical protein